MSKKNWKYNECSAYVRNKNLAVQFYIDNYLNKCKSMFKYFNLPESIPEDVLESYLQENGNCIFAKENDNLYIFVGGLGGELDEYYRPTIYTVSNPALNLSKNYRIDEDCVLVKNDTEMQGLLPIIKKYSALLTDSEITLNTAAILSRITMLISASDDKTKASAELFLQKILDGEFSIIGENSFFEGISGLKLQTAQSSNTVYLTQLVELIQYYKATFLNELGLNANFNMKRERLNTSEVAMNVDVLLPYVDNMLTERRKGLEKVNKMFGTNIEVDYSSAWKTTHEHEEKETEYAQGISSQLEFTHDEKSTNEEIIHDEESTNEELSTNESGIEETEETIETEELEDNIESEEKPNEETK